MGSFKFEDDQRYMMPAALWRSEDRHHDDDVPGCDQPHRGVPHREAGGRGLRAGIARGHRSDDQRGLRHEPRRRVDGRGGGYNLVAVNVPVRFDGEVDHVEGGFSLVVWENKVAPILPGREATGIPKIGAQIEEARHLGGRWMAEADVRGQHLPRDDPRRGRVDLGRRTRSVERGEPGDRLARLALHPECRGPGCGAESRPRTYPQGGALRSVKNCQAAIEWKPLTWLQRAEPGAHRRGPGRPCRSSR